MKKLLSDLRAIANAPGYLSDIVSAAADQIEMKDAEIERLRAALTSIANYNPPMCQLGTETLLLQSVARSAVQQTAQQGE